jgi:exoribonuclease-2
VIIRVVQGEISLNPVVRSRSRDLVREAMLMTGEAAAKYAQDRDIPFPYTVQNPPDLSSEAQRDFESVQRMELLSTRYTLRRFLKRSQLSGFASPHAGLGLPIYSRLTSPLRRYADLLAHQQLRAHLTGQRILNIERILERGSAAETAAASISQAEALSRRHWTLVYLQQHPGWTGTGVLVEKVGSRGTVIIPELALETPLHLRHEIPLDSSIPLVLNGINLAELQAHFSAL